MFALLECILDHQLKKNSVTSFSPLVHLVAVAFLEVAVMNLGLHPHYEEGL